MDPALIIAQNREIVKRAMGCLMDESLSPVERFDLAEYMLSMLPQVDFPIFNEFGDGLYVRECAHPAGSVLTSVMHLYQHPLFLLKGKIAVFWLEGDKPFRAIFTAPTYTITRPGTRRIVIALEDSNAVAVWRADEADPAEIMARVGSDAENPLLDRNFVPGWRRGLQPGGRQ